MATVENQDYSLRRGKLSKDDDLIYRIRNGKQQIYRAKKNTTPATKAQKNMRSLFGKVNASVNIIMADPAQLKEWEARFKEQTQHQTVRQFVFASIREQLEKQLPKPKRKSDEPLVLPRGIRIRIKPFAELTTTELYEILKARYEVFMMEQHIHYQDLDNIDYAATHLALFRRGQVIGYARVYRTSEEGVWQIGRLLSLMRGKGFGMGLFGQAVEEAKRQGARLIRIHAQKPTVDFYKTMGFQAVGTEFMEAGIPHVCMELKI